MFKSFSHTMGACRPCKLNFDMSRRIALNRTCALDPTEPLTQFGNQLLFKARAFRVVGESFGSNYIISPCCFVPLFAHFLCLVFFRSPRPCCFNSVAEFINLINEAITCYSFPQKIIQVCGLVGVIWSRHSPRVKVCVVFWSEQDTT